MISIYRYRFFDKYIKKTLYMLRYKIGFLLSGLFNNYNFIVVFSYAYMFSEGSKFVNPSLLIFVELVPGFITQIVYPIFLYKISYPTRILIIYSFQLASSSCLISLSQNHDAEYYVLLFSSLVVVSISSYFGECTILSLSASYDHNEMKFWSIGTGLASLFGTGSFLLNLWMEPKVVFLINFFLYLFGYGAGIYLLEIKKHIEQHNETTTLAGAINNTATDTVQNMKSDHTFVELESTAQVTESDVYGILVSDSAIGVKFFLDVIFVCIGYFFGYLIGFLFVPVLSPKNFDYQITQFVIRSSQFFGRTLGNYIITTGRPLFPKTWMFNILHIYTLILLIVYSILVTAGKMFQHGL